MSTPAVVLHVTQNDSASAWDQMRIFWPTMNHGDKIVIYHPHGPMMERAIRGFSNEQGISLTRWQLVDSKLCLEKDSKLDKHTLAC